MLSAAAVLGTEFDVRTLERMVEAGAGPGGPADVGRELDKGTGARLLNRTMGSDSHYRFVHDLVHETLIEQMSTVRRAQLHEAAGHAILALHPDNPDAYAEELAVHFDEAAVLGSGARAASWSLTAARQAVAGLAPDDAVARAERGLAHAADDDALVLDLLIVVTEAQAIRMDLERHRSAMFAAIDAARRLGDPVSMARAIDRDTAQPVMGTIDEELLAIKQAVLAELGPEPTPQRVRLLLSSVYQRTIGGQGWTASDQAHEALTAARALADPDSLLAALYALASSLLGQPDLVEQRAVVDELTALSDGRTEGVPERHGLRFRAPLRLITGDRRGFDSDAEDLSHFADRTNSTFLRSMIGEWRVLQSLLDGELEAAEQRANGVLAISGDEPNFLLGWFVEMVEIRTRQSRIGELLPLADETLAQHPELPVLRACVAGVHLSAGDEEGASSLADALYVGGRVALGSDWLRPAALGYLAPVTAATRGREECLSLADELEPYAGQLLVAGAGAHVAGLADHCRALVLARAGPERLDEALLLTRTAIDLADAVRSPVLATDVRITQAEFMVRLGRAGDRSEVASILDQALSDARSLGLKQALTRLEALGVGR